MGRVAMAFAAAAGLAGCAIGSGAPPPPPEPTLAERAVVLEVHRLELGRTRNGFMLTAFGAAEGAGWRLPALRPAGADPDGMLRFEFVAIPPETIEPGRMQALRADRPLLPDELRGAAGVRVTARAGAATGAF